MAINPFFGNFRNEQKLLDDLTVETIKAMGLDVYYIPREYVKYDQLFGEDILSKFQYAYPIEAYTSDVMRFGGQKDIISKFGIEITDRMTFQISITRFRTEVTSRSPEILKPREGDLIYFPLSRHLFEINFVEDEDPFYQHGGLTTYQIVCELFTYSNEAIQTGNTDIDVVEEERKMFLTKITLGSANTALTVFAKGDIVYQVSGVTNGSYSQKTYQATVADFSSGTNTFLYVSDETGTLNTGINTQTIIRKDGLINYFVSAKNDTTINVTKDPKILQSSGDNTHIDVLKNDKDLFDFSDVDPFSEGKY